MYIKTDRLLMVPCTEESYKDLADTYKMGPHIDMHVEELKTDCHAKGWGVWFVIHSESDIVIGDVGFKGKPNHQTVEIGYGIQSDFQNQGFATEAVNAIKNWAFASNQVTKIIAECATENAASMRVLEKIGMSRTSSTDNYIYWQLEFAE